MVINKAIKASARLTYDIEYFLSQVDDAENIFDIKIKKILNKHIAQTSSSCKIILATISFF